MSSSSSNPQLIYDVFINFRGKDTRHNFVSHLYAALSNAGVNAFLDDEGLGRGDELKPELLRAIEGSLISLVVLSEKYSASEWCLDELVKILECQKLYGQVVIPIFYNVEPSDVRCLKGALPLGEGVMPVRRWLTALEHVANLSGWHLRVLRTEAEAVKKIVDDVLIKLEITFLPITEFPVGLESRVNEVIEFIESPNQSSKVCVVGIWGMGGLGKTTIAKAIYNQIHPRFEDRSFIENIREVCEYDSRGHIHLQEQLLSNVLKTKVKNIISIAEGTAMIKKRLSGKKTLVILDDVTTNEQLKSLCGNGKCFGRGSVLIVTTRDARLLSLLKADYVCSMKEMDQKESLELLSWHAFGEGSPRRDLLSRNVVAYCGGLPLALEVLGSYLNERSEQEWRSVLSRLERIPNDQVQKKLRISYDCLRNHLEKDIFLDICCFFVGKDRAYVTEILNGCGLHADIGIIVLTERSLIKVDKQNKIRMHSLLRDMGREIVRESSVKETGKRSRLWFHDDIHDVLTRNSGTETVEGLAFKLQRTNRVRFSTKAFKKMKKLRLLQLDGVDLIGDYKNLSKELRWISWQGFTFKYIPNDFYQGNLVVIELKNSSIKHVWKEAKLLENLKILNLSHSRYLENTPDFSNLPNLEKLVLKDCPSLLVLHQSIGELGHILVINLKDCTSISNLPMKIYQLKSLKTLILCGCTKIDKLEEDIVQMESLTTLTARDTAVKEVPYSILRLKSIEYISLCGYKGLSRDVFPSLIWSWMSPTMNSPSHIPLFVGMSLSLVPMDVPNNHLGYLLPLLSSFQKLRSVWIQCSSDIQLTQDFRKFLADQHDVNFTQSVTTSHALQNSYFSLSSLLIEMGNCDLLMDTPGMSISQGLASNDSSNFVLPGDNYSSWLAYTSEGPSVHLEVPEDIHCFLKGIVLCVTYSSTHGNIATECLNGVFIVNYKKFTIQIFKRDTIMSYNDEDWQCVISNLGPGDNVEVFVAFEHGLTVKETSIYLIYGESIDLEVEPSTEVNVLQLPNAEMEPSPEANVQPLRDVKMEPSPKMFRCHIM